MNTDWARQRRNLVGVSAALSIFWGAGGQLDESILIGQSARLEQPITLVVVATTVWLYLLWRYWLYSKEFHPEVGNAVGARFRRLECYRELIDRRDVAFRNASGVSYSEAFQELAIEDEPDTEFKPIPTSITINRGLWRHTLTISVDNPTGEYSPDSQSADIPSFEYEKCRMCAIFQSFLSDRIVSDLVVPYMIGILPLVAWILGQLFM